MDKIKKFLLRLSNKERSKIMSAVSKIALDDLTGIDVKKLRGYESIFRVRVGAIRIIFRQDKKQNRILEISRRNDFTYKNF